MATDQVNVFLIRRCLADMVLLEDESTRTKWADEFAHLPFVEQYSSMMLLFTKLKSPGLQWWLMETCNLMTKADEKNRRRSTSVFKSSETITQMFIRNFSDEETLELRNTIWGLMS